MLFLVTCDRQVSDPRVAMVAGNPISLEDYQAAYVDHLKHPASFDSPEVREAFLEEMVNRRLLSSEARKLGYDTIGVFQNRRAAYFNMCMREAHYEQVIEPQIVISDSLVREVFQYSKEKRHLKHLFILDSLWADSIYHWLGKGGSFNEAAQNLFQGTPGENGGDLGWVRWEQLEYDLAMVAFRLQLGTYSQPVEGQFGWHIFQVLNTETNPLLPEQQFQLQRENMLTLLNTKMGESIANTEISNLMKQANIQLHTDVAEQFARVLGQIIPVAEPIDNILPTQTGLKEHEHLKLLDDLDPRSTVILAEIDGIPFTLETAVYAISHVPRQILLSGFKPTLDHLLRDELITRDAQSRQLGTPGTTAHSKARLWEESQLSRVFGKSLNAGIAITSSELDSALASTAPNALASAHLKQEVLRKLRIEKQTEVITSYRDSLWADAHVTTYPATVHKYYESILEDLPKTNKDI